MPSCRFTLSAPTRRPPEKPQKPHPVFRKLLHLLPKLRSGFGRLLLAIQRPAKTDKLGPQLGTIWRILLRGSLVFPPTPPEASWPLQRMRWVAELKILGTFGLQDKVILEGAPRFGLWLYDSACYQEELPMSKDWHTLETLEKWIA